MIDEKIPKNEDFVAYCCEILMAFSRENPQLRFRQILSIFELDKMEFYQPSEDTYIKMIIKYDMLQRSNK